MTRFHLDRFDGVTGGWYAVRRSDGKETGLYPFRWMAWLAGLRMSV